MMKDDKKKLTLDCPVTYQIKVPGKLDASWADMDRMLTFSIIEDQDGHPVTNLTGSMDQAALQGLLRRLYSLGLPLISVVCLDFSSDG